MIRPRHALMLAQTKLRSKRGMLIASIIVSSLLFAVLIAAIIIFQGGQKSAVRFVEAAHNERYLVSVQPNIPQSVTGFYDDGTIQLSAETIRDIKEFEKEYYDAKRAQYKAAGVQYDASLETSALKQSLFADPTIPEDQRVMIEWSSPVIDALLEKKFQEYAQTAKNKFSDLKLLGAQYGALDYYAQRSALIPGVPAQRIIIDGKEDFAAQYINESQLLTADKNALHNGSYSFIDDALLQRSLPTEKGELKGIPIIASAQETVKLFGTQLNLQAEPEDQQARASWLQQVQNKATGFTYQVCYRNTVEQGMLDKIQRDHADMKAHEGDKDYQKPSLLYQLPETACGDITIKSDTRTTEEKKAAAAFEADQKKLGTYIGPEHRVLTFQIVGVVYAEPYVFTPTNVTDFAKGLLSGGPNNTLGMTAPIPAQLYASLPASLKFDDLAVLDTRFPSRSSDDFIERIVAFRTIDEARTFISEAGCPQTYDGTKCPKQFYTSAYGSNYLLLDDLAKTFTLMMSIALPVALGFALVIIWFTMSRMMAENRKETAIYRAMGARRSDIAAIYITYTLLVALYTALAAVIVGAAAAFVVDFVYAPQLNATAVSMFGAVSSAPSVSLFDISSPLILGVVGLIFVVSLLASIQPLVRNVLRSPVNDMRSE